MKPKGWRGESRRHSMARKGITTAQGKPRVKKFKSHVTYQTAYDVVVDDFGLVENKLTFRKNPDEWDRGSYGDYRIEWEVFDKDGEVIAVEVIGIWVDGDKVVDYDGVMDIPKQAIELLKERGFDTSEIEYEFKASGEGKINETKTLINKTGFGDTMVEFRVGKEGKIQYRQGTKLKGKKWRDSKFDSMEEMESYLRRKDYLTDAENEEVAKIMGSQSKKYDEAVVKLTPLRAKIRGYENRMIGGRIDSLSEKEQSEYFKLLDERKSLERVTIEEKDKKFKARDIVKERGIENIGRID